MNRSGGSDRRSGAGFTLPEMLMVVVVIGVMLALAVPGFTGLLARNALTAKMNEIVGAVQLARSEAVTRNQLVTICRREADGSDACDTAGGWENGWIVFVESNSGGAVGTIDAGEAILATGPASSGFRFLGPIGVSLRMSFRPDGSFGAGVMRRMYVCRGTEYEGSVTIDVTGRPSSARLDAVVHC